VLSPLPEKGSNFRHEDYNAPTTYVKSAKVTPVQLAAEADITPRNKKKRRRSLVGIITASIVALLVIISGMGYMAFQAAIAATVTVAPRVQTMSRVFTMSAKPTLHTIDVASSSLPANVLSSTKTGSLTGPTSGASECVLGIFDCQQAVSLADIDALASQERPTLRGQISQDLQQQAQSSGCTTVGKIFYTDGTVSANPPLGTVSKTVTVTLTEQGSVECVKAQDSRSLALMLFRQQVPESYALIDSLTQVGSSVVKNVDENGVVTLQVPVAGVAQYQIPREELLDIQTHINGMKLQAARSYIASKPGLDTNQITVHVSYGDTIPNNVGQIHISTVTPINLPPVQLPKVQASSNQ
jgi:hypothetical protein